MIKPEAYAPPPRTASEADLHLQNISRKLNASTSDAEVVCVWCVNCAPFRGGPVFPEAGVGFRSVCLGSGTVSEVCGFKKSADFKSRPVSEVDRFQKHWRGIYIKGVENPGVGGCTESPLHKMR